METVKLCVCDQNPFMDIIGSPSAGFTAVQTCVFYGLGGLQKQSAIEKHFIEKEQRGCKKEGGLLGGKQS